MRTPAPADLSSGPLTSIPGKLADPVSPVSSGRLPGPMPLPQQVCRNRRQQDLDAESGHRRRSALVTWGFPELLQRPKCWAIEVLLVARRTPAGVCPGHAHQRCPLGIPASTGLPHRESRLIGLGTLATEAALVRALNRVHVLSARVPR